MVLEWSKILVQKGQILLLVSISYKKLPYNLFICYLNYSSIRSLEWTVLHSLMVFISGPVWWICSYQLRLQGACPEWVCWLSWLAPPSNGYGSSPARNSYGGYAPPSYGYGYAPARTSCGGYVSPTYEYAPVRTSYNGYAPPCYGYGYAPARTSYADYAPPSYGYEYAPARNSYGGYAPPTYGYAPVRTFYGRYANPKYGYAPARPSYYWFLDSNM